MMNEQQKTPHLLLETTLASIPGHERQAMEQVAEVVHPLHLPPERLANLKTAVAEAVMNAMEHGNHYQPDQVVVLQVLVSDTSIVVRIHDQGEGEYHFGSNPTVPNLEAKLAEQETPRGWGLFLIKNLVDEMNVTNAEHSHTVELIMHRKSMH